MTVGPGSPATVSDGNFIVIFS